MRILVYPLAILLLFASCIKKPTNPSHEEELTVQKRMVHGSNEFGFTALQQINDVEAAGNNVFISPLSLSMALGMTTNGAEGDTKAGMLQTLGASQLSMADVNQTMRDLRSNLLNADPAVTLNIANAIWYKQNFNIKPAFTQVNELYYDAQITGLNFNDPASKDVINNWVSNQTNGSIPALVDQIAPENIIFLTNAVYFNANWTKAFDTRNTNAWPFTLSDGSTVMADMMYTKNYPYFYYGDASVQIADIPYENGAYSFTVLLPKGSTTLNGLIQSLSQTQWDVWMDALDSTNRPGLYLPKLDLSYNVNLKEVLSAMGMSIAFSPSQADFSNIADANLYITNVTHKTRLTVDETGTEAAGGTSVGVGVTSIPSTMFVNKPFLVVIREKETGAILFVGKIENPTAVPDEGGLQHPTYLPKVKGSTYSHHHLMHSVE